MSVSNASDENKPEKSDPVVDDAVSPDPLASATVESSPEDSSHDASSHENSSPNGGKSRVGKPVASKTSSGKNKNKKMSNRPSRDGGYQVCIHVGPRPEGISPTARFVEISPAEPTPQAVLAAFTAAHISPGDLRAETVCSLETDRTTAILVYAALLGYAQRRVDVITGGRIIDASRIDALARSIPDVGKPAPVIAQAQVGVISNPEVPSILFASQLSPVDAAMIRYARRVRFAPADEISAAITQLLVVCGLRARSHVDRFPYLVVGTEPAAPAESPLQVPGFCLDTLRTEVLEVRRKHRSGDRKCIVPAVDDAVRRPLLEVASAVPIETALRLLGGRQNTDTGLWHCPRPQRHNNGDANASMRTTKGLVRCYRCDGERVDSLRLTVDVLGLSPDDAAEWLTIAAAKSAEQDLERLFEATPAS